MGKRSDMERVDHDAYDTPLKATWPLLVMMESGTRFCEPCAGRGSLVNNLINNGLFCAYACDIEPRSSGRLKIHRNDAMTLTRECLDLKKVDLIITNPPWTREIMHPMIAHFLTLRTSWLLIGADWMHTQAAAPLVDRCSLIVSVGRVRWIEGTKMDGKDNCCWYRFDPHHRGGPVVVGRQT